MERTKNPSIRNAFGVPDIGIPAEILFNPDIPSRGKILFGFLRNLSQGPRGCWASNEYLAMLLNITPRGVRKLLAVLEEYQYIHIQGQKGKNERNIYINPEYVGLYRDLVAKTHSKILKPMFGKEDETEEQKFLNNENRGTKVPQPRNKSSIEYVSEYVSNNNLSYQQNEWKKLNQKYGKNIVQFVRWFLLTQKQNYPNHIKEEITPNSKRVLDSLSTIELLCRIDGFDFDTEIKPILEQVPEDNFWSSKVLSLRGLRTRSRNNGEKKFANIKMSIERTIQKKADPVQILNKQTTWPLDHVRKSIFEPLWAMANGSAGEATVNMVNLIQAIKKQQKRPSGTPDNRQLAQLQQKWEQIPKPFKIAEKYIHWLQKQSWISTIHPSILRVDHKVFKQFLSEYQKNVGYDVFTGRSIT